METKEIEAQKIIERLENNDLGNIKDIAPINNINLDKDNVGWKPISLELLPTQGLYYPDGTKIAIRAATFGEIRHWSMIDDNDPISIEDSLNYIIEKCVQIIIPGKKATYRDLKEIDRFYLVIAIREITFKEGENDLIIEYAKNDGNIEKIKVQKEIINYFNPPDKLMKFYSHKDKCFVFNTSSGIILKLYIPSLGVVEFLKNYNIEMQQNGKKIDEIFQRYSLFLFDDWRKLDRTTYNNMLQESYSWDLEIISILSNVVDLLKDSVSTMIKANVPGEGEVAIPLSFQGGIKSIFIVSDILDKLK